jgi:acyl-CoA thioester hydrolase
MEPFRCLFRVRYAEVDAQKIVFNSRWGEFTDAVVNEFFCATFQLQDASKSPEVRLVRQLLQWHAPGHFDDVIEARVTPERLGTSSFTLRTEFRREGQETLLVEVETVYVAVDTTQGKSRPLSAQERAALGSGARGIRIDLAGPRRV